MAFNFALLSNSVAMYVLVEIGVAALRLVVPEQLPTARSLSQRTGPQWVGLPREVMNFLFLQS